MNRPELPRNVKARGQSVCGTDIAIHIIVIVTVSTLRILEPVSLLLVTILYEKVNRKP